MPSEATTSPATRVEALEVEVGDLKEALREARNATREHQQEIATLEDEMSTETDLGAYRDLEERHAEANRAFTVARNNVEQLQVHVAEREEELQQARKAVRLEEAERLRGELSELGRLREEKAGELAKAMEAHRAKRQELAQALVGAGEVDAANAIAGNPFEPRSWLKKRFRSALQGL